MKRFALLTCLFCLLFCLCSCLAGQRRGVVSQSYLSSSRPAICIGAPGMTLKAGGQGEGYLHKSGVLGGLRVQNHTLVYADGPQKPMAIIVHSELPEAWIWTTPHPRIGAVDVAYASFGGQHYDAWTYMVPVKGDPFSGMAGEPLLEEKGAVYWIARHFVAILNFRHDKVSLEYREPLPQGLTTLNGSVPGFQEFLRGFEERAEKAFKAQDPAQFSDAPVSNAYAQGPHWRYLDDAFLGDVMLVDPISGK